MSNTIDLMSIEVRWYQSNGKHRSRIATTREGHAYVIGDWSWNRKHPTRQESIENQMMKEVSQ